MGACLLLASIAFAAGFTSATRFRVWILLPLAGLVAATLGLCGLEGFATWLFAVAALQCGYLAGATARGQPRPLVRAE